MVGFLLSLVLLLLKPGRVLSVTREWCLPNLEDLLLLLLGLLAVVEADEVHTILLESRLGICDPLLLRSSRVRDGPQDGKRLLRGGTLSFRFLLSPLL